VRFSSPLISGRFLRREKRFLAEVELAGGERVWSHVPNTGALRGCALPGQEVLLTQDGRPGRKTQHTWRFVNGPEGWICIDTLAPNRLVAEALAGPGLPGIPPLQWAGGFSLCSRLISADLGKIGLFGDKRHLVEAGVAFSRMGHTGAAVICRPDGSAVGHWPASFVVQRKTPVLCPRLSWTRLMPGNWPWPQHGVEILVIQEKVAPPEINLASTLPYDLT
jgi:hypothetical protein